MRKQEHYKPLWKKQTSLLVQNKKITIIKVYKKKSTSVYLLIDFLFLVNDKVELLHEINHVLPYLPLFQSHTFS